MDKPNISFPHSCLGKKSKFSVRERTLGEVCATVLSSLEATSHVWLFILKYSAAQWHEPPVQVLRGHV